MKRMKLKMKKIYVVRRLLATILIVGLLFMMPYDMATVHADFTPSINAYVTKEELMDWPYEEATLKIHFGAGDGGHNPNSEYFHTGGMSWWVLGKDDTIDNDNIALFAAANLEEGVCFNQDDKNEKYYEGTHVYPNHYGASDVRQALNDMMASDNETHFTNTEKSLMQPTDVTTYDAKSETYYNTLDVLYLPHGETFGDISVYVGGGNSKELKKSMYWYSKQVAKDFFLRDPRNFATDRFFMALTATDGSVNNSYNVTSISDKDNKWLMPATNLNVSDLLFASVAHHTADERAVMSDFKDTPVTSHLRILRWDGSDMDLGEVIYDSAQGKKLFVKKSPTVIGNACLVIQGNDGINDWYYSRGVKMGDCVDMADVKAALNLSEVPSIDDCEIWLETMVDMVLYAKMRIDGIVITEVDLTIDAPVAGNALDTQAETTQQGLTTTTPEVSWKAGTEDVTGNAEEGMVYTAYSTLETIDEAIFASDVTVRVNGNPATVVANDFATLTLNYVFPEAERITPPPSSDSGSEDPSPNPGNDDPDTEDTAPQLENDDTTMEDEKDEVPSTGDNTSAMIPFVLMLASVLCVVSIMANGRIGKKHEEK